jgi:hypothetical protein
MAGAGNVYATGTSEAAAPEDQHRHKERMAALLCILVVATGVIFGPMYLLGFDFLRFR